MARFKHFGKFEFFWDQMKVTFLLLDEKDKLSK